MFEFEKNKLQSLPENIGKLSTLRGLNLANNKFTKLPDSIGDLAGLTDLNVSFNGIRWLPESFKQLNALQVLQLADNPSLNALPEFTHFPNLRRLNIRNIQVFLILPCVSPSPDIEDPAAFCHHWSS